MKTTHREMTHLHQLYIEFCYGNRNPSGNKTLKLNTEIMPKNQNQQLSG